MIQAEEEARSLQKKIQTVENELDQTQEALTQVNAKLDEKNKALQNVSLHFYLDYILLPSQCNFIHCYWFEKNDFQDVRIFKRLFKAIPTIRQKYIQYTLRNHSNFEFFTLCDVYVVLNDCSMNHDWLFSKNTPRNAEKVTCHSQHCAKKRCIQCVCCSMRIPIFWQKYLFLNKLCERWCWTIWCNLWFVRIESILWTQSTATECFQPEWILIIIHSRVNVNRIWNKTQSRKIRRSSRLDSIGHSSYRINYSLYACTCYTRLCIWMNSICANTWYSSSENSTKIRPWTRLRRRTFAWTGQMEADKIGMRQRLECIYEYAHAFDIRVRRVHVLDGRWFDLFADIFIRHTSYVWK